MEKKGIVLALIVVLIILLVLAFAALGGLAVRPALNGTAQGPGFNSTLNQTLGPSFSNSTGTLNDSVLSQGELPPPP